MNEPRGDHLDALMNDYLDGRLDDAARRAFEQQMAAEDDLREQVAMQQKIQAGLRHQFVPGSASAVLHRLTQEARSTNSPGARRSAADAATTSSVAAGSRWRRFLTMELGTWQTVGALAAVVLLAVGGWFWWANDARPGRGNYPGARSGYGYAMAKQTPVAYYHDQIAQGFQAQWECPPDRLEQITGDRFTVTVTYQPPSAAGVAMLGASYANIFSPQTVTMLARVNDQPVVIFLDRRAAVTAQELAGASGSELHLHERALEAVSLYELSPWDQPSLLPLFSVASTGGAGSSGGPSHAPGADSSSASSSSACPLH